MVPKMVWLPIYWKPTDLEYQCNLISQRSKHVIVQYGNVYLTSCYTSPNCTLVEYAKFLDKLEHDINRLIGNKVLICGDFNSNSEYWSNGITNPKGELVEEWAATHGLILINTGTTPTCVRPQGNSVVDLTWATPTMADHISNWWVDTDTLILSDHRYVQIQIGRGTLYTKKKKVQSIMSTKYPRWSWSKMDTDLFVETLELSNTAWKPSENDNPNADTYSLRLMMIDASDIATKRIKHPERRKQVY